MTSDQLLGILRTLLAAAGGYVVAKGWTDAATATAATGAIITLLTAGWSFYTHSKTAMIKSVNSADNGVKVVSENAVAPQVDKALR